MSDHAKRLRALFVAMRDELDACLARIDAMIVAQDPLAAVEGIPEARSGALTQPMPWECFSCHRLKKSKERYAVYATQADADAVDNGEQRMPLGYECALCRAERTSS